MKNEPHFRIIEHQAFIAVVPMYTQNTDGTRTPILAGALADLQVYVSYKNGATVSPSAYTVSVNATNGVLLDFANGLDAGVYSVLISANYGGRPIRCRYNEAFEAVVWNRETTYNNFITGQQVVLPEYVFVMSADTQAIAELQAQLEQVIAAAQAAKEEWERKAAELDGVAQQSTLTQGVADIREDISHIDIDTTSLAKETTADAAKQAALDAKTAAQGITGYALQGSDATATNTAIAALIGYTIQEIDGV